MGKYFYVIMFIFNVFFMCFERGNVKPVCYGIDDDKLDDLKSFGVKVFEDFIWKYMFDFYTCVDCGWCFDCCLVNVVKCFLSLWFIFIKGCDYVFKYYFWLGCNGGEL